MAKTVTVASRMPMSFALGNFSEGMDPIVIAGTGNPEGQGNPVFTENLDAEAVNQWMKDHAEFPAVKAGMLYIHDGEAPSQADLENGFQPALDRAKAKPDEKTPSAARSGKDEKPSADKVNPVS